MTAIQLWDALRWLERSSLAEAVRVAPFLYPLFESLHVLGIAMLVGSVVAVDLRLLGVARNALPVTTVTRYLLPVSRIGFLLVVVTGLAMFSGIARRRRQCRSALEAGAHHRGRYQHPGVSFRRLSQRASLGCQRCNADARTIRCDHLRPLLDRHDHRRTVSCLLTHPHELGMLHV